MFIVTTEMAAFKTIRVLFLRRNAYGQLALVQSVCLPELFQTQTIRFTTAKFALGPSGNVFLLYIQVLCSARDVPRCGFCGRAI